MVKNGQQHLDLETLVKKLRYVTATVQVMPFIYSIMYIVCMLLYLFCSDSISVICDSFFYVSPVVIIAFLILSKLLRMCIWHKTVCVLPLVGQVISFIDRYVIQFTQSASVISLWLTIAMFGLLLICAYKIFIK